MEPSRFALDLLVLDQFFASSVAVTLDTLATANLVATSMGSPAPFRWRVVTPDGAPVTASSGLRLAADGALDEPARGDLAFAFGVGMADVARIQAALVRPDTVRAIGWLRAAHERGCLLAASCSSTFLLAETGRLEGCEAATSWWLAPLFRARYPGVRLRPDAMVTEDRGVLCAGAALAQVDLVHRVVAVLAGDELAGVCARYLAFDDGAGSQAPFVIAEHLARLDPLAAAAQAWMSEHLAEPFTVAQVARHVGVSERTLSRRILAATGLSATGLAQRLRVERAAALLRGTVGTVDEVARAVGYTDGATLRRLFRRYLGRAPAELRRVAQVEGGAESATPRADSARTAPTSTPTPASTPR